jgi:hypothetical protein
MENIGQDQSLYAVGLHRRSRWRAIQSRDDSVDLQTAGEAPQDEIEDRSHEGEIRPGVRPGGPGARVIHGSSHAMAGHPQGRRNRAGSIRGVSP